MEGAGVRDALYRVKRAQEERARTYSSWDGAFKALVSNEGDQSAYEEACAIAQGKLNGASTTIIALTSALDTLENGAEWAILLRQMQQWERRKFELTIERILLRTKFIIVEKDPFNAELSHRDQELRKQIALVVDRINGVMQEIAFELA